MKIKEFDKDLVHELYINNGYSLSKISKILETTSITLRKWMVNNGFNIDSKRKFKNDEIELSTKQEEILFGGLLGDAHLTSSFTNPQIQYISSQLEHVEYFQSFFKEYSVNECIGGPKKSEYFDSRTNKIYYSYKFRSIQSTGLLKYRNEWYDNKIKKIPKDFKLTKLMCLIWYLGDGSIQNDHNKRRTELIKLSTNNFYYDDVNNNLIPQLKDFDAYIGFNESKQPVIRIPRKKIVDFLRFIGPCPIKCYDYKWIVYPYKYKKYEK